MSRNICLINISYLEMGSWGRVITNASSEHWFDLHLADNQLDSLLVFQLVVRKMIVAIFAAKVTVFLDLVRRACS